MNKLLTNKQVMLAIRTQPNGWEMHAVWVACEGSSTLPKHNGQALPVEHSRHYAEQGMTAHKVPEGDLAQAVDAVPVGGEIILPDGDREVVLTRTDHGWGSSYRW